MIRRIENALVAIACLIPFVRLGIGEIQPWDESLYVIRAEACLKFGAWLDQTKYAVGHLYSAWHPPLGIWFIAISEHLFGNTSFALRLPIALAGSISVLLMWFIVRHFASSSASLIATISLAASDLFLHYSHRAQLECFQLVFILAAILFLIQAVERNSWSVSILAGVLFGFALQVKIGYGLYVLPILILLPWALGKVRDIRYSLIMMGVGLLVAMPWFWLMSVWHPEYWNFVGHSLSTFQTGKYSPTTHAWWYYENRLFVALPLLVTIFFVRKRSRILLAGIAWLLAVLLVLEIFATTMAHFAFLLVAPGALLIGLAWDSIMERPAKWRAALFLGAVLAIAWSASEQVRLLLTHHLAWNDAIFPSVSIIIICIGVGLAAVALARIASRARYAVALSLLLLGLAFSHLLSEDAPVFQDGAAKVASLAAGLSSKSDMIVIHPDFPHEQYAPQLAYYTGGWTLGWIPNKTSQTITWDSAATPAYAPDTAREIAVIMNYTDRFNHPTPAKTALWDSLTKKLQRSFSHERVFRSFVVFY